MKHIFTNFIAGVVAVLPILGVIFGVVWIEDSIFSLGLENIGFYFPGFGIILSVVILYIIGFLVTSFIGKYIWNVIDKIFEKFPIIGHIYMAIKEILGYDTSKQKVFLSVVSLHNSATNSDELGLVTKEFIQDGKEKSTVFIPSSPNITNGRLIIVDSSNLQKLPMSPNEALKTILAIGKVDVENKL